MALTQSTTMASGWEAKDFSLKGTDERLVSLGNFSDKKGLLLIFSCNHCPYAKAAWPLMIELCQKYGEHIGFVAINPNDEVQYPDDSFEQMKIKKEEWKIPFPYLRDESQEVARDYRAQCTPDPFLFKNEDGAFKLFYRGRLNDNWQNPQKVKERNLEHAISALLDGESPPENQPPSMGCSIKWKESAV